jgi:hypothetical protein
MKAVLCGPNISFWQRNVYNINYFLAMRSTIEYLLLTLASMLMDFLHIKDAKSGTKNHKKG